MAEKKFTFIAGTDDFLVTRMGKEVFREMTKGFEDEFSQEVIDGASNNLSEVEAAVKLFYQAVTTLPMFGGRKVVWMKDISFLADSVTGRADGTLLQLDTLKEALETVDPTQVGVLFTASPVDRRRAFFKWCEKNSALQWIAAAGEKGSSTDLSQVVGDEARRNGISFTPGAVELIVAKLNGNTRILVEEVAKLAAYLGPEGGQVEEALVMELVPNFGDGNFFESADAFFSLDLSWTLDALRRHFFAGNEARALISTLQGRNRLLIQLRTLLDAGEIQLGHRGLDKGSFDRAAATHRGAFGENQEKGAYNVFSQNPWYLGRLAEGIKRLSLKRLIDFQQEFLGAFEEIIVRPNQQEEVLREMAIRCLGRKG
jgi:DNA polymerase III subunit delta